MGAQNTVILAGAVQNFGNAWAETLKTWIGAGLMIALGAIVIIHAVRKMSIKAAIGGLIGLVICWSIYANRTSIASMFDSEYTDHPGAPAPAQGAHRLPAELPVVFTGRL
ncbi:hypothetical protein [Kitasatospora sp. NPDC093679]|uniref:hypothetical protein n=1 Tax=Kitasatospora sp. NPDC093679 TaxID=3154983 RepID=UPI00343A0354